MASGSERERRFSGFDLGGRPDKIVYANFDGEFTRASQLFGGKGGIKVLF